MILDRVKIFEKGGKKLGTGIRIIEGKEFNLFEYEILKDGESGPLPVNGEHNGSDFEEPIIMAGVYHRDYKEKIKSTPRYLVYRPKD